MSSLPAIAQDPSAGALVMMSNETASNAVAAQAKALVEARYTVAFHRPRDWDRVRESLLKECRRPSFAAVARYRKPVGAGIEGPSIRFAEAALRCMTNITIETMTVYDDREKRIVRVAVTDLEANVPYSLDVTIEKTIERRSVKAGDEVIRSRLNKQGDTVHLIAGTEDDILNKQNALISKAIRTLGLRLVPGDLVDECMTQVKRTKADQDAKDPDAAKRQLFDAFLDIGISAEQLKDYLDNGGAALTAKELADLRGLYAAIRDGEATWREAIDAKLEAKGAAKPEARPTASAKLRQAAGIVGPTPGPTEQAIGVAGEYVDTRTGEIHDGPLFTVDPSAPGGVA